jgi:hypothetical protein
MTTPKARYGRDLTDKFNQTKRTMERDYYYITDGIPDEIKGIAIFIACFHLTFDDFIKN